MPHDTYASEQEVTELRDEIRRLREEQEALKQHSGNGAEHKDENHGEPKPEDHPEPPKSHRLRNTILIAAGIVLVIGGLLWWLHARHFESTDDAQVDGHVGGIAARIAGTVSAVYVEENQFVKAGQVLVDIDPHDYENALAQARSQVSQAQAQAQAEQPNVPVTQETNRTNVSNAGSDVTGTEAAVDAAIRDHDAALAKIREAQANAEKAQADVERYRPLAEKEEISHQQFDQVVANAKALTASVASARATAEAAQGVVDQRRAQLDQARQHLEEANKNAPHELAIRNANVAGKQAATGVARAQLDQAILNLSYCKITAPVDGIVARRVAEVGQRLAPGQDVVLIAQTAGLWITANFRETQLRLMRNGQPVRIHIDAVDSDFNGSVESMPAATGSVTSVLPPENASGNFVKVVQRLPVRIRFAPNQSGLDRLRPGMSAEPRVTVR